jgi:hypothetical protein
MKEASLFVVKLEKIPEMQATAAACSTKLYSNDVMCPVKQSIVYDILLTFWVKRDGKEMQKRGKERENIRHHLTDQQINFFLLLLQLAEAQPEEGKHKKSTLYFFSFAMAFFVSFSYSPSCGTLQRYYLSSFVTTSKNLSRRISCDVVVFCKVKIVERAPQM